jgi:ankyrin repeat protein
MSWLVVASKMNLREAKDAAGRNALHLAAEMGRLEVCRFLVEESGFEVNFACAEGAAAAIAGILRLGGGRTVPSTIRQRSVTEILPLYYCVIGGSPVHCAAAGGSESVLGYLLDHGGDPVMPDSMGSTPLHDAAEEGAVPPFPRGHKVIHLSTNFLCSVGVRALCMFR